MSSSTTPAIEKKEHETFSHIEYDSTSRGRARELGHYNYGNQCHFAYGTRNGDARLLNELQPCRMFYYQQTCKYEDSCRFLHVNGGSSGVNRSGFGKWEHKGLVNSRSNCDRVNPKPVLGKTKLCRNLEMTGSCLYGRTCKFAHGQAELRKLGDCNSMGSGIEPMKVSNTFSTVNDQTMSTSKCGSKRKELEKISGIYADWIEDMPPFV